MDEPGRVKTAHGPCASAVEAAAYFTNDNRTAQRATLSLDVLPIRP
jgi:hypothetical protein